MKSAMLHIIGGCRYICVTVSPEHFNVLTCDLYCHSGEGFISKLTR